MSSNNYITPDIASILRSLAATASNSQTSSLSTHYTNPISAPRPQLDGSPDHHVDLDLDLGLEEGEYDPNDALIPISGQETQPSLSSPVIISQIPTNTTPTSRNVQRIPKSSPMDPRSITTYPAALRHITKIVARDETTMSRIRKLIASQHQHERQWWDGRQALIKQQGEREGGRKKVEDVL